MKRRNIIKSYALITCSVIILICPILWVNAWGAAGGGVVQGELEQFKEKLEAMKEEQEIFNQAVKQLEIEPELGALQQGIEKYVDGLFVVHLKVKEVLSRKEEITSVITRAKNLLEKNISELNAANEVERYRQIQIREKIINNQLAALKEKYVAGNFSDNDLLITENLKSELETLQMEKNFFQITSKVAAIEDGSYREAIKKLKKIEHRSQILFDHLGKTNLVMSRQIVRLDGVLKRLAPTIIAAGNVAKIREITDSAATAIGEIPALQKEFGNIVDTMSTFFGNLYSEQSLKSKTENSPQSVVDWLRKNY